MSETLYRILGFFRKYDVLGRFHSDVLLDDETNGFVSDCSNFPEIKSDIAFQSETSGFKSDAVWGKIGQDMAIDLSIQPRVYTDKFGAFHSPVLLAHKAEGLSVGAQLGKSKSEIVLPSSASGFNSNPVYGSANEAIEFGKLSVKDFMSSPVFGNSSETVALDSRISGTVTNTDDEQSEIFWLSSAQSVTAYIVIDCGVSSNISQNVAVIKWSDNTTTTVTVPVGQTYQTVGHVFSNYPLLFGCYIRALTDQFGHLYRLKFGRAGTVNSINVYNKTIDKSTLQPGDGELNSNTTTWGIVLRQAPNLSYYSQFAGISTTDFEVDTPYSVGIGGNLLYQCTSLRRINLQYNITHIHYKAFSTCTALEKLTLNVFNPPEITGGSPLQLPGTASIYVPAASLEAYRTAEGWSDVADRIYAIT